VNTQTTAANCGSCGNACPSGSNCSAGVCGNLPNGNACPSGAVCQSGCCISNVCRAGGNTINDCCGQVCHYDHTNIVGGLCVNGQCTCIASGQTCSSVQRPQDCCSGTCVLVSFGPPLVYHCA
jgi:hypothetical protein